ncbi:creatininase family protein [Roseibacterium sp. SDUM158017]|uniref:creatininase family protein n=1 Tax=Roseicyclus salinarum TaxID=3036773 RepID=UPI002414DDB1|nr:creatininase family protein [Roseibacterium sp. SDUM158017]MDG4647729.1 creatininase family protein [Roseibacterium sp. SDUM158017]
MTGPRRHWREMTTRDFSTGETGDWIAVLPIAAIEQHGPHLPVGVDALIAEAMVARCAEALPPEAPVTFLPVQQVCKSNEHVAFPGTLTLDWDTAIRSWLSIGHGVARAGLRKLVIVTSHGGNVAPMEIVARELRQTHAMAVATTAWTRLASARAYTYPEGPMVDIHGGLSETSMMLALHPELVRTELAEDFASAQTALRQGSAKLGFHMADANLGWLSQDLNPKGTVGDASSATAALGAADIASQVEGFVALMQDMMRVVPPEPV